MTLGQMVEALQRRWKRVILLIVAGICGGALALAQQTPQYDSSAQVFVSSRQDPSAQGVYQGGLFAQERVQSYVRVARNRPVMVAVIRALDLRTTPEALARTITVSAPMDTVLIDITARSPSAREAQRIAAATSKYFIQFVNALERPRGNQSATINLAESQPAYVPRSEASPSKKLYLGGGLLIGLALAVAGALGAQALDSSVRVPEDLPFGTSVIGSVPRRATRGRRLPEEDSIRLEAMRQIRTALQFVNVDDPPRSFACLSARSGDGKTAVAVGLAIVLAQAGNRTLLIDGDLRRPELAKRFDLTTSPGLTDILVNGVPESRAVRAIESIPGLDVLTSGPLPSSPSDLLGSVELKSLLRSWRETYEYVVIDSSPLLSVTDAAVLASEVDGAVVVARHGATSRRDLETALSYVRRVGAPVLGVVLNQVPGGSSYSTSRQTPKLPTEGPIEPSPAAAPES